MIDYCCLCDEKKNVDRSEDYSLKICRECNDKYPENSTNNKSSHKEVE
tara:strand:+ start:793 stop:936 length:144 start_codon:yes stop_codon:yes gene_type:complete